MRPIADILTSFEGLRPSGQGYLARCPAHDDHRQSLSIREASDGKVLLKCHAGCATEHILHAVGLTYAALFPEVEAPISRRTKNHRHRIVATYDYTDAQGHLLFQVVRYEPKDFRQRRRDPSDPRADRDGWVWNLHGIEPVLYRLPQVLQAVSAGRVVFLVEGETSIRSKGTAS